MKRFLLELYLQNIYIFLNSSWISPKAFQKLTLNNVRKQTKITVHFIYKTKPIICIKFHNLDKTYGKTTDFVSVSNHISTSEFLTFLTCSCIFNRKFLTEPLTTHFSTFFLQVEIGIAFARNIILNKNRPKWLSSMLSHVCKSNQDRSIRIIQLVFLISYFMGWLIHTEVIQFLK